MFFGIYKDIFLKFYKSDIAFKKELSKKKNEGFVDESVRHGFDWCAWFFSYDGGLKSFMLDQGIRTLIASWYWRIQTSSMRNNVLFETVIGKKSVEELDPLHVFVHNIISMPIALYIFAHPCAWTNKIGTPLKKIKNILSSWIYYHMFYCVLFNKDDNSFLCTNSPLNSLSFKNFWPNNYMHTKQAMYGAFKTFQHYILDIVHDLMYKHIDPCFLQTAEDVTMGIVRPEIIGYMIETFTPLMLLRASDNNIFRKVILLDRDDVYSSGFVHGICQESLKATSENSEKKAQPYGSENKNKPSSSSPKENYNSLMQRFNSDEALNKGMPVEGYYIEYRILTYIFSSIGSYWGQFLVKKYPSEFKNLLLGGASWFLSACETMGFINEDVGSALDNIKGEISESFDMGIVALKEFLLQCITDSSQELMGGMSPRAILIAFLRHNGNLRECDCDNQDIITKRIIGFVLSLLSQGNFKFLSRYDALMIEGGIANKNKFTYEDVNDIITIVLERIKTSILSRIGSSIGSNVSYLVYCGLDWWKGPFYPKVKNAVF